MWVLYDVVGSGVEAFLVACGFVGWLFVGWLLLLLFKEMELLYTPRRRSDTKRRRVHFGWG